MTKKNHIKGALLMVNGLCMILAGCEKSEPMTIVCIGDSLTACGGAGGHYTDYLQSWLPDCRIVNKGIGGDTLAGGRARFQTDVLDLKPDIVVLELGANDYWRASRSTKELSADLEWMVRQAKKAGADVVLAGCFGGERYDDSHTPTSDIDRKRQTYAVTIATAEGKMVDTYGCYYIPDMQVDIRPNGKAPYWSDNNHPNKTGNRFVAKRIYAELQKAIRHRKQK
mgnify:CR=1 FL=1